MNPLSKLLLLFIAIVAAPAALAGPYDEAVLADEPVAYWRFEEPEGATTAVDSGSSKTDGTYVEIGLAKPSASDVLGTAAEWGNDGDGSSHIDFGEPNAGALGQLVNLRGEFVDDKKTSVEFWMNTSQEGNPDNWRAPVLFGEESGGDGDIQWGYLLPDGNVAFALNDAVHQHHQSEEPVNDQSWHHVVITYDWEVGKSQLYVDGSFESDFETSGLGEGPQGIDFDGAITYMGWNSITDTPGQYVGLFDEVAIYDKILSAERVAAHFTAAFTDSDNDGLPDDFEMEAFGNLDSTGEQDNDSDGLTNLQEFSLGLLPNDPDFDKDGVNDGAETRTGVWVSATDTGPNPKNPDTDADTIPDGEETNTGVWVSATDRGTNPHERDSDEDGLRDNVETNTGVVVDANDSGTDPNKADTDGDGASDRDEIRSGTNPFDAADGPTPIVGDTPYDAAVLADGPIAYWRFEDPARAFDSGTSGTDGEYNGITFESSAFENLGQAAVYAEPDLPDNPGSSNVDFGEFNVGALAQLANIDAPEGEFFDPNKKTSLEFWMKTSAEGNNDNNWRTQLLFGEESPGDGDIHWGYLRPSGQLGAVAVNDGNHSHHETADPVNDDAWHHVVVTYDWETGISNLYLDGEFESEFEGGENRFQDQDGGEIRYLGWNSRVDGGAGDASPHILSQFVGSLDEVAIYDKILRGATVSAHFAAASEPAGDPSLSLPRDTIYGLLEADPAIQNRSFLVRNGGKTQTLNISGVTVSGADADHFTVLSNPSTLGPGESAPVEVRFNSKGQSGGFIANVDFASNAEDRPIRSLTLSARIEPPSGVTSYYRLDETEGEVATDSGGLARNGAYVGDLTLEQEAVAAGSSVAFNGGYVEIDGRDFQTFGDDYSISLWANASGDALGTLFSKGDGGAEFILASTGGSLIWFVGGLDEDENQKIATDAVLTNGQSHHIVLVQTGGEAIIYVDGNEVGRAESPAPESSNADFLIGALNNGDNIGVGFPGRLDDVQVFEKALTAEDVAKILASPGEIYTGDTGGGAASYADVVMADGAVAYWRFEEAAGATTATDSSGGGTEGTYNGITLGQPGPSSGLGTAAQWSEPGEPGSSNIDFGEPGLGAIAQLTNIDAPQDDNFSEEKETSLEFWMKTSQVSGNGDNWRSPVVFGRESPGDGDIQWGWVTNGGEIGFAVNDAGGGVYRGPVVNDDQWHHVVQTFDFGSGEFVTYVDGAAVLTETAGDNRAQDADALIQYMGWNHHVDGGAGDASPHLLGQYVGLLDEVAIYPSLLSAEQVKTHYDLGAPPASYADTVIADGAVAYWRFEEAAGATTATDSTGGGTDGTYNGITLGQSGPSADLGTAAQWSEPGEPGSSNIDFGEPGAGAIAQLTNIDAPQDDNFDEEKEASLEFWLKTSQVSGNADNWRSPVVFGRESPGDGDIQWGWVTNGGEIGFAVNDAGGGVYRGPVVNDDRWHHVVQTFDFGSGEFVTYVDGAAVLTETAGDNRAQDADALIQYMGWNHHVDGGAGDASPHLLGQYVGLLDEVAIYPSILSAEQVQSHFDLITVDNSGGPVIGDGDLDNDGASDANEAIAGTDPNDPTDSFRILTALRGADGVELSWPSVDGKVYDVEYSPDLITWTVIAESVATADGIGAFIDVDADRTGSTDGYYRAMVR